MKEDEALEREDRPGPFLVVGPLGFDIEMGKSELKFIILRRSWVERGSTCYFAVLEKR